MPYAGGKKLPAEQGRGYSLRQPTRVPQGPQHCIRETRRDEHKSICRLRMQLLSAFSA